MGFARAVIGILGFDRFGHSVKSALEINQDIVHVNIHDFSAFQTGVSAKFKSHNLFYF